MHRAVLFYKEILDIRLHVLLFRYTNKHKTRQLKETAIQANLYYTSIIVCSHIVILWPPSSGLLAAVTSHCQYSGKGCSLQSLWPPSACNPHDPLLTGPNYGCLEWKVWGGGTAVLGVIVCSLGVKSLNLYVAHHCSSAMFHHFSHTGLFVSPV